ncbi:MAG: AAA family ATPase, partial [Anaerolineae bacterium]|nr:AAA family ATPase [Anaerolineae bacterium]
DQGYEKEIRLQVVRRREAQLAAMIEGEGVGPPEVLTFTGDRAGRNRDQWLERTVSGAGQRLAAVRDRVLDAARIQRHHLLLDLNAASGLLTWEALRRAPEGGVVALARSPQDADALRQQAERLPDIERPRILNGDINDLPDLLATLAARPSDSLLFDAIVGRNALTRHADKPAAAALLASMLAASGAISLAETVPSRTQRLYKLVDLTPLGADLARRVEESEEGIYSRPEDPMVNWDEDDLRAAFAAAELDVAVESQREESEVLVTAEVLARWFTPSAASGRARPSYADHLRALLNEEELTQVGDLFRKALLNRPVPWQTTTAFITAH